MVVRFGQAKLAVAVLLAIPALAVVDATTHPVWRHRKLFLASSNDGQGIDNEYIVVLEDTNGPNLDSLLADLPTPTTSSAATRGEANRTNDANDDDEAFQSQLNGTTLLLHQLNAGLLGGVVATSNPTQLWQLLENPRVAYIEQNQKVHPDRVQHFPPWNVDHSDNPQRRLDWRYQYQFSGQGVDVFVVDTGLRVDHNEFGDRASCGLDVFDNDGPNRCHDRYNHGTHVAGTIGGRRFGLAKHANLIGVKVMGGSNGDPGSTATVIEGLEYVIEQRALYPDRPMVVNLSFGTPTSLAVNEVVEKMVAEGIVVIASAGNDNADACNQSPASATSAITVAASNKKDAKSKFSNYGACVNIFAPGEDIRSASSRSQSSAMVLSGTSMAAPLVSGIAALYLEMDPTLTPEQVWNQMHDDSAAGLVPEARNSPNLIISASRLNDLELSSRSTTCATVLQPCKDDDECCTGKCRFMGRCLSF